MPRIAQQLPDDTQNILRVKTDLLSEHSHTNYLRAATWRRTMYVNALTNINEGVR